MDSTAILNRINGMRKEVKQLKEHLAETTDFIDSVETIVDNNNLVYDYLLLARSFINEALLCCEPEVDSSVDDESDYEDNEEGDNDDYSSKPAVRSIRKVSSGDSHSCQGMRIEGLVLGCEC